jgi:hypothetical protein
MSKIPTLQDKDHRGYDFVETSEWWKTMCEPLPSFAEVWWPDYATKVIEETIGGKPVVIQLWKGWCQRFLGRDDFPGGIGAEVGIYRREAGRVLPENLPDLPGRTADFLLRGLSRVVHDRFWWPFPALDAEVDFELVNPRTNDVFFAAKPQRTYWRNRWMNPDSYEHYRRSVNHEVPMFSAQYTMRYRINGQSYEW